MTDPTVARRVGTVLPERTPFLWLLGPSVLVSSGGTDTGTVQKMKKSSRTFLNFYFLSMDKKNLLRAARGVVLAPRHGQLTDPSVAGRVGPVLLRREFMRH